MTVVAEKPIAPFVRPEGHDCRISSGIHSCLTFGTGELSDNGFGSTRAMSAPANMSASFLSVDHIGHTRWSSCKKWAQSLIFI